MLFGNPLKTVKIPMAGGELTITQFPVLRAIRVGARLTTLAAPVLAGAGSGLDLDDLINGKMGEKIEGLNISLNEAVPKALNALAASLDPEAFGKLCEDALAGGTWTDGKNTLDLSNPAAINVLFGGSIPDLFGALKAALQANDFFGLSAIGKLRGLLQAPAAQTSPDKSTPT